MRYIKGKAKTIDEIKTLARDWKAWKKSIKENKESFSGV